MRDRFEGYQGSHPVRESVPPGIPWLCPLSHKTQRLPVSHGCSAVRKRVGRIVAPRCYICPSAVTIPCVCWGRAGLEVASSRGREGRGSTCPFETCSDANTSTTLYASRLSTAKSSCCSALASPNGRLDCSKVCAPCEGVQRRPAPCDACFGYPSAVRQRATTFGAECRRFPYGCRRFAYGYRRLVTEMGGSSCIT